MTQKYLKYSHPSAMGYDINKSYSLNDLQKEISLDMIKVLFIPIGFEWNELEIKNKFLKNEKNN